MNPRPRTRRTALHKTAVLALVLSGVGLAGTAAASPTDPTSDSRTSAPADVAAGSAIVRLSGAPLAASGEVNRRSNDKVVLTGSKTKSVSARLAADRKAFRTWLRNNAPKARITGEYDFMLNAVAVRLHGTPLSTLRSAPGVAEVVQQGVYVPTAHEDPDLALIDGPAGWSAAGATPAENQPSTWAGFGVKVGVIDTGIDAEHPCFEDSGFPQTRQFGDNDYTNNKVIVARVFNNQVNRNGFDAAAIQDHGTHVAGTVACDLHTPAVVEGADIPYDPSGVAPGAQLGNYNVFPGDIESARTEDILNAMQAAARDGMDVINMSLGGDTHGKQDLGTIAVDNLDLAGIVVAVSAGNEGPGDQTVGSPGMAERALTAGASSVGHYVGVPISSPSGRVTVAATGDFAVPETSLTAPLAAVMSNGALSNACTSLGSPTALAGKIALVSRGECSFGQKILNAQNAGALAAIVVNNVPGDPTAMGGDGINEPTIPAVMAPLSSKQALIALNGQQVTIGANADYIRSGNDNILAGFSSRGAVDVSFRVKPDVVAPGVNVLSSIPLSFCAGTSWVGTAGCWAFMQGTSMASPHLAGMAAVVRDAHPTWQAWQVRSAIVNTAKQNGVKQTDDPTKVETRVQYVGSGLADLDAAVLADVALSQPSVSFGAVPRGSGQTLSTNVQVTNLTGSALTLPVSVEDSTGDGSFTASPGSVTLDPNGTATITVRFSAPKGATPGSTQAILHLGSAAHAALYAFLK